MGAFCNRGENLLKDIKNGHAGNLALRTCSCAWLASPEVGQPLLHLESSVALGDLTLAVLFTAPAGRLPSRQ